MKASPLTVLSTSCDSKSELLEYLRASPLPYCLCGQHTEASRVFRCLTVMDAGVAVLNVGLLSADLGGTPVAIMRPHRLIIGFDCCAVVIDLNTFECIRTVEFLSVFYEFLECERCPHVCVLCETAIIAISDDGDVVWRKDTDIITDVRLLAVRIQVKTAECGSIELDLLTGREGLAT